MLLRQGCPWCNNISWESSIFTPTPPTSSAATASSPFLPKTSLHPAMALRVAIQNVNPTIQLTPATAIGVNPTIFLCFKVEDATSNPIITVAEGWHYGCLVVAFKYKRNLSVDIQQFAEEKAQEFHTLKQIPDNYLIGDVKLTFSQPQEIKSPFQTACDNFMKWKKNNSSRGIMHLDKSHKYYWKQIFTIKNPNNTLLSEEDLHVFPNEGWTLWDFHIENEKNFFLALNIYYPVASSCWSWLPCYPKPVATLSTSVDQKPIFPHPNLRNTRV